MLLSAKKELITWEYCRHLQLYKHQQQQCSGSSGQHMSGTRTHLPGDKSLVGILDFSMAITINNNGNVMIVNISTTDQPQSLRPPDILADKGG